METKKIPEAIIELLELTSVMQEVFSAHDKILSAHDTISNEEKELQAITYLLGKQIKLSSALPSKISELLADQIDANRQVLKPFDY